MSVKTWKSESLGIEIQIDHDKCEGCEQCVQVCPVGVFEMVEGKSTAPNIDQCIQCCACVNACPTNAITHSSC